jgi:hypothetical protein
MSPKVPIEVPFHQKLIAEFIQKTLNQTERLARNDFRRIPSQCKLFLRNGD